MAGQVVQITINVTDGNASEAVSQVVAQLNAIGPAGAAGGAEAAAGLDTVGEHALTSLDNVRLLRDDLGIHIPRAMEKAISQSALLSGAIGTMGTGLLALGAGEIFLRIGESIYNAYEKYLSLNAAQDEFAKAQQELKDKDFVNVHSLETAVDRLQQAQSAVEGLKAASKSFASDALHGEGPGPFGGGWASSWMMAHEAAGGSAKSAGQKQEISPEEQNLMHQLNMQNIETAHAGDVALHGEEKRTAELQKQLDIDKEKQRYTVVEDTRKGNPGTSQSGASLRASEDEAAKKKYAAEELELQRQYNDQVITMQNAAVNAGLEGNALRAAQEMQEIDAVTRKFQEGEISKGAAVAERAAIEQKFGAEAMKLQQQLDEQTKHLSDEANQAGMKGMQLLSAQLQTQLDAINAAERKAVGPGGVETAGQSADFNSQRNSAQQSAMQRGLEEQGQYEERIRSLMESSDDFELQGYARIEAATRKHLDELAKEDAEYYGDAAKALEAYNSQAVQVETDADRERQQLHHRTMEQLTKEEQETARLMLPEWQQAMLAIEDQYTERMHQVQQDVKTHVMTEQEGAAAVAAAWQLASAQMQKDEEQTRDKIASGLQSLFSHPEKFFEDQAMKTGFQLMANEMLSVFQSSGSTGGILQYLFGMGPQMNTSTNPLTSLSSALGLGGHHSGGVGGVTNPSMMQFQQGSTTLLTGSQALLQAANAVGAMGAGGGAGSGLGGMGIGGFGLGGGTVGGAGVSASPFASGAAGLGASSPMPETTGLLPTGSFSDDGSFGGSVTPDVQGAASSSGGLGAAAGIAGGALMGGMSIYSAYQNSNPIAGAVGGASGGMEVGSSIGMLAGGPAGALLGGVIGGIAGGIAGLFAGIFGDQGRGQAEGLDVNTIQPELLKDMQDYQSGRSGYSAVASDLNNLLRSSQSSTGGWGSGARNYFNSNIQPEINAAISSLQKQEIGGRSAVTLSAGQFHSGGLIGDFGDLATSDTEGFIHAMRNEMVMNPAATAAHAPILSAMNAGTNFGYSSTVQPRMPASSGSGGMSLTIQALDSKTVAQWAKAGGGRSLVSAMNQAQTQYSGKGR